MINTPNFNPSKRKFIKSSLIGGISFISIPSLIGCKTDPLNYELDLVVPTKYFDGTRCWCHPRAGIVPEVGTGGLPRVVMTMNNLDLAGSDVFYGVFGLQTDDLGNSWTEAQEQKTLAPRYETIDGVERPVAVSDFWPRWHTKTKTLLGTGHTVAYTTDWKVRSPRPRHTSFATYDPASSNWSDWKRLEMPGDTFGDAGAGCVQRYDQEDGTILLPIYFRPPGKNSRVTVCKCLFDGEELQFQDHGSVLELNNETRGLGEPSLTKFGDRYFMTIRNDEKGFVAQSTDGQIFDDYKPWTFDDGTELGSYNTQQHWVTHSDALFLVYTRRGANNDHVFRHRAPLFMAQVDPEKLCVIRETEQVLVPERGARLGNFGVTDVSPTETWVTVAEWMQPHGVEKYGSDGSVFVARIQWNKTNRLFG